MPKYVLIVNFQPGLAETPMEEWKPEEVEAHLDYYRALSRELEESGEQAQSEVLAGPDLARIVTSDGTATVVRRLPAVEGRARTRRFPLLSLGKRRKVFRRATHSGF